MRRSTRVLSRVAVGLLVVALAGGVSGGVPVAGKAFRVESVLPQETLLFVSVDDLGDTLARWREAPSYRLIKELDIAGLIKAHAPKGEEALRFFDDIIAPLGDVFGGQVAMALVSLEEINQAPRFVLVADVRETQAGLEQYLEGQLLPFLRERGAPEPETFTHEGVKVSAMRGPGNDTGGVCWATSRGVFVAGASRQAVLDVLGWLRRAPADVLEASASYRTVREKCGGSADLFVFVNTGSLMVALQPKIEADPEGPQAIRALGLAELEAVGLRTSLDTKGSRVTLFLHTGPQRRGFIGLLGQPSGPSRAAALAPEDAALFFSVSVDSLGAAWDRFLDFVREVAPEADVRKMEDGLKRMAAVLGGSVREALLDKLGGEVAVMAKVPETLGIPPAALFIEVKDAAAVEKFVGQMMALAPDLKAIEETYRGVTIRTLLTTPVVAPAYAFVGDYLVVGIHPRVVRGVIDVSESGRSLAASVDFKRLMERLPKDGMMSWYLDMGEVCDLLRPAALSALARSPDAESRAALDWILPRLVKATQDLGSMGGRLWGDEDGVGYEAVSDLGLVEPMTMMAAALALPAFARARTEAQKAVSAANMKQIVAAAMLYAEDHEGRLPSRPSDLESYLKDPSVFRCPRSARPAAERSWKTVDGWSDYELRTPAETLDGIETPHEAALVVEKEAFFGDGRNVGFADGSVRFVRGDVPE